MQRLRGRSVPGMLEKQQGDGVARTKGGSGRDVGEEVREARGTSHGAPDWKVERSEQRRDITALNRNLLEAARS